MNENRNRRLKVTFLIHKKVEQKIRSEKRLDI